MKTGLLILLTYCVFATAMVHRIKREDEVRYCGPTTPCGWTIYKTEKQIVESIIYNNYCVCNATTSCLEYENDAQNFTIEHRCMVNSTLSES